MVETEPDDNKQPSIDEHEIKELEQEKILLEEINSELDKKAKQLEKKHSAENEEIKKKIEAERIVAENMVTSVKVTAESMIESAKVIAESIRSHNAVKAENIIKSALNQSKNLIDMTVLQVENIIKNAIDQVDSIMHDAIRELDILNDYKEIEINKLAASARIELEYSKKTARITYENMRKDAETEYENMRKDAENTAENLRKDAENTAENLRKDAENTAENLRKDTSMESESVRRIIDHELENLKKSAEISAENLKKAVKNTAENLVESAKVTNANLLKNTKSTAENMVESAKSTAENMVEHAKVYASQSLKNAYETLEKKKKEENQKNFQLTKKYIASITIVCILLIGISVLYLNQQPKHTELTSEYLIENIKGEKVETWTAWNLIQGDTFHIIVLASPEVTSERLKIIKDVIFSNETVTAGGGKYYKGWQGALNDVSQQEHKLVIPLHFDVNEANSESGNIVIKLSPLENADGYTGYTKSIADAGNHQILKAVVTIYNVNKISNDEFAIIVRHELGHGFGLGHSDYENDLMFANVQAFPPYGYISECDVEAMAGLYNENQKSQVICTK